MKSRIAFGFLVSAALLLVMSSRPSHCKQPSAEHPVKVTVSELAIHPQKYDGKLVCVNAVLVTSLTRIPAKELPPGRTHKNAGEVSSTDTLTMLSW